MKHEKKHGELQYSFLDALLQQGLSAKSKGIFQDYIRDNLSHHILHRSKKSLIKDPVLQKWIQYAADDSPEAIQQVLAPYERAEIGQLAEWYAANNDALAAATIYKALFDTSGSNQTQARIDVRFTHE